MPMDRKLYPANWTEIAREIKDLAGWSCEECGRPCRRTGETKEDFVNRIYGSPWLDQLIEELEDEEFGVIAVPVRYGRFVLTVAHLNHRPSDCRPENLKAWCAPCHARYDLAQMDVKRHIFLEARGQLNWLSQNERAADDRTHSA